MKIGFAFPEDRKIYFNVSGCCLCSNLMVYACPSLPPWYGSRGMASDLNLTLIINI